MACVFTVLVYTCVPILSMGKDTFLFFAGIRGITPAPFDLPPQYPRPGMHPGAPSPSSRADRMPRASSGRREEWARRTKKKKNVPIIMIKDLTRAYNRCII